MLRVYTSTEIPKLQMRLKMAMAVEYSLRLLTVRESSRLKVITEGRGFVVLRVAYRLRASNRSLTFCRSELNFSRKLRSATDILPKSRI
ncbi:hypothetical protein MIMGU_mgv1a017208mg [Erythranthe guttata]|uniref:Uncharacterized protein n=1 Tax=Erythranthe guttata TaxID=4155 RepID=A0A022RRZ8_ERYGU|nr:hypothetical protein MIMGU_mgv1a017208mg [Erythranthe guttata]